MGNQKILVAGLVGGVVSFFMGYLIWGIALADFAASEITVSYMKDPIDFWAVILGSLASGLLVAVIFGEWAHIKTWMTGAKRGAMIGLLIGINYTFLFFGTTTLSTIPVAIVDTIAYTVLYTAIGAVVGLMLGKGVPALEKATA